MGQVPPPRGHFGNVRQQFWLTHGAGTALSLELDVHQENVPHHAPLLNVNEKRVYDINTNSLPPPPQCKYTLTFAGMQLLCSAGLWSLLLDRSGHGHSVLPTSVLGHGVLGLCGRSQAAWLSQSLLGGTQGEVLFPPLDPPRAFSTLD